MSVGGSSGVISPTPHTHSDCSHTEHGPKSHPIFEVIKSGLLIPVQALVEQEGISVLSLRDDKGHTPTHWACLGGHTAILRYLIENKVSFNEPSANELGARPIHWACVNGHIASVDILLQAGVDIDTMDNKHCTPLIVAAQYGQTMLAGYLMGKGARLQLTDKDGDNALHWAAFKGHNELMRLLIYSGFNAKQKDNFGQTALHLACINGNLTAVKELCEEDGVEVNLADNNGKTPLQLAIGRKHDPVVNYLKAELQDRNSLFPRIDWWAIIFGPPGNSKGALLFLVLNLVIWGYPMYIFKCLPLTWNELQILHIVFMFTNVVMWICLYHANSINPGFLPQHVPEYDQAIKQVAHFDEWKQGQNPLSRLCHTCRTVKPLRAKHCRICNRCVREFDHHCPYIHNCVGYYNRAWFFAFVVTLAVMVGVADYFCLYILYYISWDWLIAIGTVELLLFTCVIGVVVNMTINSSHLKLAGFCVIFRVPFFLFVLLINIIIGIGQFFIYSLIQLEYFRVDYIIGILLLTVYGILSLSVFIITVYVAARNITLNEMINYKNYAYLKDSNGAFLNPFDRGFVVNMLQFFHMQLEDDFRRTRKIYHAANNLTTNERINRKRYDYLKDGKGAFYNPFNKGLKKNLMQFLHLEPAYSEDDVQLLGVHVV